MTDPQGTPTDEMICRVDDNTIDTGTIPIIFVPGVMGSRLHFTVQDQYWDPDSNWRMSHWLWVSAETTRREFALTNPVNVMTEGNDLDEDECRRGLAGVAWGFYGTFIRDLEGQSFGRYTTPVYVIGYDWRQSNRTSGNVVAGRIREILEEEGASEFVLISHSMGGLVTRATLKGHSDVADKCKGVIHVAQPVGGGLVLVRRMFTGARSNEDGGWGLSTILGNTRQKFQTIMSAVPGPMQLLPTPQYRDTGNTWWYTYETFEHPNTTRQWTGNSWALYRNTASPPGLVAPATESYAITGAVRREFGRRLNDAEAYHNWVGTWKHPRTWAIYSTGLTVDMAMHFHLPPNNTRMEVFHTHHMMPPQMIHYGQRGDGSWDVISDPNPEDRGVVMQRRAESDGTVPDPSAELLFPTQRHAVRVGSDYTTKKQFRISGAAHDAICHDPNCERALFDIIRHIIGS